MLATNFNLKEFIESPTAKAKKIDNTPPDNVIVNLTNLAQKVIQPLREWVGKPIKINSGYRCPKLNAAVGGAKTSQHMTGEAADLHIPSISEGKKWFEYIRKNLPYDQLIWEHSSSGSYWIHVSCKRDVSKNRKQVIENLLKK